MIRNLPCHWLLRVLLLLHLSFFQAIGGGRVPLEETKEQQMVGPVGDFLQTGQDGGQQKPPTLDGSGFETNSKESLLSPSSGLTLHRHDTPVYLKPTGSSSAGIPGGDKAHDFHPSKSLKILIIVIAAGGGGFLILVMLVIAMNNRAQRNTKSSDADKPASYPGFLKCLDCREAYVDDEDATLSVVFTSISASPEPPSMLQQENKTVQ
eukprot:m.150743 g.150743  ORF g.150743 m.150743 type:complete len:208 (+) comp38554_c0_seq3:384-1007(+)